MSTYNAVTWLLDRNVDEGRGAKLAFTDTVSELTYGELQRQSRRAANMLRRLGVRREERVAMIMLDTVDFPIVFLGAIRAGIVPVPLNTLLTTDQYAYVLADSRALNGGSCAGAALAWLHARADPRICILVCQCADHRSSVGLRRTADSQRQTSASGHHRSSDSERYSQLRRS